MSNLLNECKAMVLPNLQNKKIILNCTAGPEVPLIIICDYQRLKQVIINLLNNSVQYTFTGHITVTASVMTKKISESSHNPFVLTESNPPTYNLVFKIEDSGTGIDEKMQKKISYYMKLNNNFQSY